MIRAVGYVNKLRGDGSQSMGINADAARFLLDAHQAGATFDRVLTLGRLNLRLPRWMIEELPDITGRPLPVPPTDDAWEFADPLLEMLGATDIVALDACALDGAGLVHDLNLPIGDDQKARFDMVIDGGTLEHVFNFPVALRSCMDMVRPGGRLVHITPTNNYCGHGFYQFSPELFFRAYSDDNGYEVERMVACEAYPLGRWFEVADPAVVGRRAQLVNNHRVLLFVCARRQEERPVLASFPQQSAFEKIWKDPALQRTRRDDRRRRSSSESKESMQRLLHTTVPMLARLVRAWADRYHASRKCSFGRQPRVYTRVK